MNIGKRLVISSATTLSLVVTQTISNDVLYSIKNKVWPLMAREVTNLMFSIKNNYGNR